VVFMVNGGLKNGMEHPVLLAIRRAGFTPLGWFAPGGGEGLPDGSAFVILIGNAGPDMFRRYQRGRGTEAALLDDWTRDTAGQLAADLGAQALYPSDKPHFPFLRWARRAGAGHVSPLGLNIHPLYGLWHAYRAAFVFPVAFDLPMQPAGAHPCEACVDRPCLSACPVNAFSGSAYDADACGKHLNSPMGGLCMTEGCQARRACPIGRAYTYEPPQLQFHMEAFKRARAADGQAGADRR
jgi:epoxyqueuosine reductase QueG